MASDVSLDSGAIAALFFDDPFSQRVEAAVARYTSFNTLDLALAEVCNVAWKRVRSFGEDLETSARALSLARDFVGSACQVASSGELLHHALLLAVEEGVSAYDALYLTLAMKSKTKLLTTDEKLHRKVESSPRISGLTLLP